MSTAPTAAPAEAIAELRSALDGAVHLPGDATWDDARRAFNLAVQQHPPAVVAAGSPGDVALAVSVARRHGMGVRVQGTGHGAMDPLDGVLLVDTSALREVRIDPAARRARVSAGAVWGDVVVPAAEHGLAALHGSSPNVGVVGYTLGGGLGWLARRHGLAANSVEAIEVVTADGRLLRADAGTEPDLFWALRGGGGSFAAVTGMEIRLYEVPQLYAGNLFWPIDRAPEVLRTWRDWVRGLPEEFTTSFRLLRLPPIPDVPEPLRGGAWVNVLGAYAGDPERGEELLRPLRDLGTPHLDAFGPIPLPALAEMAGDPAAPVPEMHGHTLIEELPDAGIEGLLDVAGPSAQTPLLVVELRHLGGALSRPAEDGGALAALRGEFMAFALGIPMAPDHPPLLLEAIDAVADAVAPWSCGSYLNFAGVPTASSELFPAEVHERLLDVRRRYDPEGVFRANHPVAP